MPQKRSAKSSRKLTNKSPNASAIKTAEPTRTKPPLSLGKPKSPPLATAGVGNFCDLDVESVVVTPTCPTVWNNHHFSLNGKQASILKLHRSIDAELGIEHHFLRENGFVVDEESRLRADLYGSSATADLENLCNLHLALNHSGNTARDALEAAVVFHRMRAIMPVGDHRAAVLRNHGQLETVEVLGRKSHGWHEGVIAWADAHAEVLERVAGFPASTTITTRGDYPPEWAVEVCKKVFNELHQNQFRPFVDAITLDSLKVEGTTSDVPRSVPEIIAAAEDYLDTKGLPWPGQNKLMYELRCKSKSNFKIALSKSKTMQNKLAKFEEARKTQVLTTPPKKRRGRLMADGEAEQVKAKPDKETTLGVDELFDNMIEMTVDPKEKQQLQEMPQSNRILWHQTCLSDPESMREMLRQLDRTKDRQMRKTN